MLITTYCVEYFMIQMSLNDFTLILKLYWAHIDFIKDAVWLDFKTNAGGS